MENSGAIGFFEAGSHSSEGIDFEMGVAAAADGFGCFKRRMGVFAESM